MPDSPPEPATLRSIHERCKTRHQPSQRMGMYPGWAKNQLCDCCSAIWPCADYSDAVAALALDAEREAQYAQMEASWKVLAEYAGIGTERPPEHVFAFFRRELGIPEPGTQR